MKAVATLTEWGIPLTDDQRVACCYLESWGFRFCIDFGYENAIERAEAHQMALVQRPRWTVN